MTAFELQFCPSASLIQVVRRFVSDFYERVLEDPDAVSRVALATHELLENAVKYSLDGATALSITVDPWGTVDPATTAAPAPAPGGEGGGFQSSELSIRLSNRAGPEHLAEVRELFAEMDRYEDPFAHYQAVMERGSRRTTGSGMGLARVRAEGEMSMSYSIEGDRVCIVAQTRVQARRPS